MTETEQYLIKKVTVVPGAQFEIELRPEKGPAFKTESLEIKVFNSRGKETWVELCNITILGDPQLFNFDGAYRTENRGTSWVFRNSLNVDFKTIGSGAGQGLQIAVTNPNKEKVRIYIKLKGKIDSPERIGR